MCVCVYVKVILVVEVRRGWDARHLQPRTTWGHSVHCPVAELARRGVCLPPRAPNVKLAVVVLPQDTGL